MHMIKLESVKLLVIMVTVQVFLFLFLFFCRKMQCVSLTSRGHNTTSTFISAGISFTSKFTMNYPVMVSWLIKSVLCDLAGQRRSTSLEMVRWYSSHNAKTYLMS